MRALSLRQPWAELILQKKKTIETRKWNTKFRGKFLIHAAKTIDVKACEKLSINPNTLSTGKIVGEAELMSVKKYISDEEFSKDQNRHLASNFYSNPIYGFLLQNIKRLKEIELKGSLGFFQVNL